MNILNYKIFTKLDTAFVLVALLGSSFAHFRHRQCCRGNDARHPQGQITLEVVDVKLFKLWLLAFFIAACIPSVARSVERIEAWSYYSTPPFQTDAKGTAGLSIDFVDYLNQQLKGKYEIRLVALPRARLNLLLRGDDRAFVIFAPSFVFGGLTGNLYLWSSAIFDDRQELVSRKDHPFQLNGAASLTGKRLVGMQGHVFPAIAKEVASGQIKMGRVNSEESLVKMLLKGHADVITIPHSAAEYFATKMPEFRQKMLLSDESLGSFSRHLMFPNTMARERDDFEDVVRKMRTDDKWLAVLKKYGLTPSAIPLARNTK